MSRIRISSDSTCDLSPEQIAKYNILITPLSVLLGDKNYKDKVDVFPKDIFDYVSANGILPKTAAVSIGDYSDYFTALKKDCDEVIHINISSDFSSCYQNACIAAEDVGGVYVIDSRNLSTGHGLVVLEAARLAEEGKLSAAEILSEVNNMVDKVDASFIICAVDYLYKGGRCSAVSAIGANLLKLKPHIEVKDGKMGMAGKYRGNLTSCAEKYISDKLSNPELNVRKNLCFVTTSCLDDELPKHLKEYVENFNIFDEVVITTAGCTVSSHCGPDCLGILYIRN